MAIISKEKLFFDGQQIIRVMKCDAKGVFSIELPLLLNKGENNEQE